MILWKRFLLKVKIPEDYAKGRSNACIVVRMTSDKSIIDSFLMAVREDLMTRQIEVNSSNGYPVSIDGDTRVNIDDNNHPSGGRSNSVNDGDENVISEDATEFDDKTEKDDKNADDPSKMDRNEKSTHLPGVDTEEGDNSLPYVRRRRAKRKMVLED